MKLYMELCRGVSMCCAEGRFDKLLTKGRRWNDNKVKNPQYCCYHLYHFNVYLILASFHH